MNTPGVIYSPSTSANAEEDISFQGVWICSTVWSVHLPGSNMQAITYEMQRLSGVRGMAWGQRPRRISHPRSAIIPAEIHCLVGSSCCYEKEIIWGKGQTFAFIGIFDKAIASLMDNQKMWEILSLQELFSGFKGTHLYLSLCVFA